MSGVGKSAQIYIRAEDLALWERAVDYAREHRLKTSGLIMLALERYLAEEQGEDPAATRPEE